VWLRILIIGFWKDSCISLCESQWLNWKQFVKESLKYYLSQIHSGTIIFSVDGYQVNYWHASWTRLKKILIPFSVRLVSQFVFSDKLNLVTILLKIQITLLLYLLIHGFQIKMVQVSSLKNLQFTKNTRTDLQSSSISRSKSTGK